MNSERAVVLDCAGARLVGILHPGAPDAGTGVVIVVGGPQYRAGSHRQFVFMARRLAAAGFPVLRFDYRGMGDAEGEPRSFDAVDDDIRAAVDCLSTGLPQLTNIVLLGLCDAASAILIYAHSDDRVNALILLNPWVRTAQGEAKSYLRHYYLHRLLQKTFWLKLLSGKLVVSQSLRELSEIQRAARRPSGDLQGGSVQNCLSFIDRMLEGFNGFQHPILLLISGRDLTAKEFLDLCRENSAWKTAISRTNVTIEELSTADHTMSTQKDLRTACDLSCDWLRRQTQMKRD